MAESDLHPAVRHLLYSGNYLKRPRVEIFAEHEVYGKDGKVARKVDKQFLEAIAAKGNSNAEVGNLSLATLGHTVDDEFDKDGKLIKKVLESQQPMPLGAYHNYEVALNPATSQYSLYVDEYVNRMVSDPLTGKDVDGLAFTATFPRRSSEIFWGDKWIDNVALLRRAPRLAMGISLHAKSDPDHAFYCRARDGKLHAIAGDMGNPLARKTRYAIDTRGAGMDEEMADPSADPTVEPSAEMPATGHEAAGGGELPPEHMEAAERYSMHAHGMHHTRSRALLQHMHEKYGAECGMSGDPMTPHVPDKNAMLSGTSAMPMPAGKEAPLAPTGAPKAEPPESKSAPVPPKEHVKMAATTVQADQDAIEKTRYARDLAERDARIKALEDRNAVSEAEALVAHTRGLALQMVYEGYPVKAEYQMKICERGKYSRQQVDEHFAELRTELAGQEAPISELPPLGEHRAYNHPAHTEVGEQGPTPEQFNKYQRAIRTGMPEEDAREKYMKGSRNGALNGAAK